MAKLKVRQPVESDDLVVEEEGEEAEVAIDYDIASYPSDLTLSVVKEMWDNKDIVVPDFQRNFVWSIRQSSLLVESFLLGLPVPQVFFYVDQANKSMVIDGQQRIMSVVYYLDGYFGSESTQGKRQVFRLQGLENKRFANKTFADLEEALQRKLKSAVLRAINIRQLSPRGEATSIYHIFERLNTGGTPLKPQEIRNCVFRGGFVSILRELNKDRNWRTILGKSTFDRYQKDVELVLRVYGLSIHLDAYQKPMKEFLNKVMAEDSDGTSPEIQHFRNEFPKVTEAIVSRLGRKPFHIRGPLNSSVLDAVFSTVFSGMDRLPDDLADRYSRLRADEDFDETTYLSTSDLGVLRQRFALTKKYLLG